MKKGWLIALGASALVLIMVISSFNGLQRMDEDVNSSWAQVENQLQRRYELIPNLVETVKGYTAYEGDTLQAIVEARNKAMSAGTMDERQVAEGELSQVLTSLNVVVEAYPDLKASKQYEDLMIQLEGTENRIAVARKDYNESVQGLNGKIRTFPTSIIASMSGVQSRDYFEIDNLAKENVKVDFSK